ncbi:MAG: glycerophosphodiester phosphodiesterase [Gemmatimonadaceae bacterium]
MIPEAIAHRGLRDSYPENSIPAFIAAVDAGADAIELDVHATRDGVVVVHHDPHLSRESTSSLAGRAIAALGHDELSKFELQPGVGVPTLEATLEEIAPRARVYIEIKAPEIESSVAAALSKIPNAAEQCAVHSFDHRIVKRFRELATRIPGGILLVAYPIDAASLLRTADARDFWAQCEFIDRDLVESIHDEGGRVIAWTGNDEAEWSRLRAAGVDGICTDRVGALVSSLRD